MHVRRDVVAAGSPPTTQDLAATPTTAATTAAEVAHRADLDGIRGIAVILVVLYHAGLSFLPGAYVAVDTFFVLSGYLITQIVRQQVADGRFSLGAFYLRRARRILPAQFVVIATTLVFGLLWLTPRELRELSASTATAALWSSNITFWLGQGYFETASALKPMLMTWSLSVEGQFYLLYPLLFLPWVLHHAPILRLLPVLLVLSFLVSCALALTQPEAAFYLLPSRIWELLLGAGLTLFTWPQLSRRAHDLLAVLGVALIGFAFITLHAYSRFPGWNALAPCVGTALLIVSSRSWINRRLLASGVAVFFGLISYSLYLWHWPILSLARITWGGPLPPTLLAGLIVLSVALAAVTYRWIEQPARRSRSPWPVATRRYLAGLAALVIASLAIASMDGLPGRLDAEGRALLAHSDTQRDPDAAAVRWGQDMMSPLPGTCFGIAAGTPFDPRCQIPGPDPHRVALLWGDSHAAHFMPGVRAAVARQGLGLQVATLAGCRPYQSRGKTYQDAAKQGCEQRNRAIFEWLDAHPEAGPVILAGRWSQHAGRAPRQQAAFAREWQTLATELRARGHRVVILGEVPAFTTSPAACELRRHLPLAPALDCHTGLETLEKEQFAARAALDAAAALDGVCFVEPLSVLCEHGLCAQTLPDGRAAYWDADHLTRDASRWLDEHGIFDRCLSR